MYDFQKVTAILMAEVGYAEKETNAYLNDPTANAGDGNYTKYARDLAAAGYYNTSKLGVAWCAVFVNWGHYQAFGKEAALALCCQPHTDNCGAGCQSAYHYYKRKGQAHDGPPCEGDQIFFWNQKKTSRSHTGYVYAVDDTYVYTIEGNTSGTAGVVANGGAVCTKKYRLDYSRIAGYGQPDWGMEDVGNTEEEVSVSERLSSDELQRDTLRKGARSAAVAEAQGLLNEWDSSLGLDVDGVFGAATEAAVSKFQGAHGLTVDGVLGPLTWGVLLGYEVHPGDDDAEASPETVEPSEPTLDMLVASVEQHANNLLLAVNHLIARIQEGDKTIV